MPRILRILGIILLVLIIVLVVAGVGIVTASNRALNQTFELYDVPNLTLPEGDELDTLIEEGQHIYITRGCTSCHGDNGGGAVMIDDPALGTISASNFTSGAGGVADNYETVGDWVRAIQHGVRPDGTSVFIMPSKAYSNMREAEMLAVIAYIQSLEPVDNDTELYQLGPVGRALIGLGQIPPIASTIDHDTVFLSQVEKEPSVEYGATLGKICMDCHGENLGGAESPDGIWAHNLTSHENGFVGNYDLDGFVETLRTGQTPDGRVLDAAAMPYAYFGQMDDIELEAIYLYLQSVEAVDNSQPQP